MATLITGATGFLGGRLARDMLARGEEVVAIGRNEEKLSELKALGARTMQRDIVLPFREDEIARLHGVTEIVHCAALSSAFGIRRDFHRANAMASRTMAILCRAMDCKRFVHISSPSIYASLKDRIGIRETDPLPGPINHYAATKRIGEEVVLEEIGERAIVLRPRGIYGSGDNALIPTLRAAVEQGPLPLLRGGRALTDLTHVDDVVRAIHAARQAPASACGRAYNISGGAALSVKDVVEAVAKNTDLDVRWRKMPMPVLVPLAHASEKLAELRKWSFTPRITRYTLSIFGYSQTLDISAARDILGWVPTISFEDGLAETFGAA